MLENFWDEARSHGLPLPQENAVSAASFCEARHKIKTELFCKLLHHVWKLLRQAPKRIIATTQLVGMDAESSQLTAARSIFNDTRIWPASLLFPEEPIALKFS